MKCTAKDQPITTLEDIIAQLEAIKDRCGNINVFVKKPNEHGVAIYCDVPMIETQERDEGHRVIIGWQD